MADPYAFAIERYKLMMIAREKAQQTEDVEWFKAYALLDIAATLQEIEGGVSSISDKS